MRKSSGFLFFILLIFVFGLYIIMHGQQLSPISSASSEKQVLSAVDTNAQCHAQFVNSSDSQAVMPDPNCTPGAINSEVTQDTIDQTICHPGFTKTIRPP